MPLMKLALELDIAADRVAPGLVLPAYFNPEDPGDFVLVW
jgi:hypothetical protein